MEYISILLVLTASCGQTPIEQILDHHATHFGQLPHRDLEYEVQTKYVMYPPQGGKAKMHRTMTYRLRTRDVMYRIDIKSMEENQTTGGIMDIHPSTRGFNGERYFRFSPTYNNLTLMNEREGRIAPNTALPYLLPFAFAAYDVDEDRIAYLRRPENWDALAALAKPMGQEKVGAVRCSVYEFASPEWRTESGLLEKFKVFFADNLSFFPIVVEKYRARHHDELEPSFALVVRRKFLDLEDVGISESPYYTFKLARSAAYQFGDGEQTAGSIVVLNKSTMVYGDELTEAAFFEGMEEPASLNDRDYPQRSYFPAN